MTILLVINDVLHSDTHHRESENTSATVANALKHRIGDLVELAALAVPGKTSLAETKLKAIIDLWASSGYISAADSVDLHERVADGRAVAQGATPQQRKTHKLPEWFGNRNVPWHELSASYMIEPLLKKPGRPIVAGTINVMPFDQKQPSDRVRTLLETYLENSDLQCLSTGDKPTGETKKYKFRLDSSGQLIKQNKATGETSTVYNSYGWSTELCKQLQDNALPDRVSELREVHKKKAAAAPPKKESRWDSSSRNYGRDAPRPDRRYENNTPSPSASHSWSSHSCSRSRSRSRSYDRSRSHSRSSSHGKKKTGNSRPGEFRRRSSHDEGSGYNNRSNRFDRRGRRPSDSSSRNHPQDKKPRWNGPSGNQKIPPQQRTHNASATYPQAAAHSNAHVPAAAQPQRSMSGYVPPPPPPPPGQFAGYSMSGFPPPPPPPQQYQGTAPPPPPPPNFQGQYYGAPGGYQNSYQYGNNQTNYHNNTGGYAGQGRGNHRGGYQGGQRGGYRGGYQGQGRGQGRF